MLKPKIQPLELVLWGDLYLILMDNSPFGKLFPKLPTALSKWFSEFNQLECLHRAISLVFGGDLQKSFNVGFVFGICFSGLSNVYFGGG